MEPIGVPAGWSWKGLAQMRTTLADGREVAVTTGGSHWGAGLWCSSFDLARFGRLHLQRGLWEGRRILSERWCELMLTPTPSRPAYGLMWWRNHDGFYPGCGPRGFAAHGTGDQVVWCDPERDLVAVVRWAVDPNPVLAAITDAVAPTDKIASIDPVAPTAAVARVGEGEPSGLADAMADPGTVARA
jgi:CubicO group peptidase (beta-lactamase class C family)